VYPIILAFMGNTKPIASTMKDYARPRCIRFVGDQPAISAGKDGVV
jgi:hypothetical protein